VKGNGHAEKGGFKKDILGQYLIDRVIRQKSGGVQ